MTSSPRVPLWLPYLQSIDEVVTSRSVYRFVYNGGQIEMPLSRIHSIMIYGRTDAAVPIRTWDAIARAGIPVTIHRRGMTQPVIVAPGGRPDPNDIVTSQILARKNGHRQAHIARQLIDAKMRAAAWMTPARDIPRNASVEDIRQVEARHARDYWAGWMGELGHPEWTRRGDNPAAATLDAISTFVSGIVLRWVAMHHLSPYHGYLHTQTTYPALVYDLIEPYRPGVERAVLEAIRGADEADWMTLALEATKAHFDERIYVPLTRQEATRHEMIHGIVLSLRALLLGEQRVLHVPREGNRAGGRPRKGIGFTLRGRSAGAA